MEEENTPGLWDGCKNPISVSMYSKGDVTPGEVICYDCGECDWCRLWGDPDYFSPAWHMQRKEEEMYAPEL